MNRVQKRTLREIDRRVSSPPEINGSERRAEMRSAAGGVETENQINWLHAHKKVWRGRDGLAALSIDEIQGLLYADAWCKAYNRTIWDYVEMFDIIDGRELEEGEP